MHSRLAPLLLSLLLVLSACNKEPVIEANGESVTLAVLAPTEGLDGFKGRQAIKGMEWALSLYPLMDGGTGIDLMEVSVADEPAAVSEALRRLAADDKVLAVISLAGSNAMLAAAPLANRLEIPLLAASATNPEIVKGGSYVSQVIYDDSFQGAVAALFVRDDLLIKRVAVVSNPDNPYSRFLAGEFSRKFESIGGEIVEQVHLTGEAANYTRQFRGLHKKDPELIYMTVGTAKLMAVGVALNKLKWRPRLMGPDGALSSLVKQFPKRMKMFEGMLATDVYTRRVPLTRVGKEYSRVGRDVINQLDTFSVLGIEAMAIAARAVMACGEAAATRQCVAGQVRQTRDFSGILGRITIGEDGRAIRPLVINSIKNGAIVYRVRVY